MTPSQRPRADSSPPSAIHAVEAHRAPASCPIRTTWLRRLGFAGFMFFLIKGLLWLTIPAAIAIWRGWGD